MDWELVLKIAFCGSIENLANVSIFKIFLVRKLMYLKRVSYNLKTESLLDLLITMNESIQRQLVDMILPSIIEFIEVNK